MSADKMSILWRSMTFLGSRRLLKSYDLWMLHPTDLLAVIIRLMVIVGNAPSAGSGSVKHVVIGLNEGPANVAARACKF